MDSRISLYKLEVLCEVVDAGSVTRAARSLGVAQPVVTGHIRSLEKRLGARLFERQGRGLMLTPAGQIAHTWAHDVVARTREAATQLDEFTREQRSRVTVVVSTGEHPQLTDLMVRFQAGHPAAALNLRAHPTELAVAEVLRRAADFALVLYAEGVPSDPALQVERLRRDEVVLVSAPSASPRVGQIEMAELADLPFICTPAGSARRRFIDEHLRDRGVQRRQIVMEIGPEGPLHAAVRDGLGCALLSRSSVTAALASGELQEIEVVGGLFRIGLDLVSRRDLELSQARQAFVHAARQALAGGS